MCLVIKNKYILKNLLFIINDVIPVTDKNYISCGLFSNKLQIYYLVFKDLNIFSEKKTNLGLFMLKNKLNFKMFCTGKDLLSNKILLRNMKIYNF